MMNNHVVLLGDSIFDNALYVPRRPAVIEQLRDWLGDQWQATLLAKDGAIASDVANQLKQLPDQSTHLIISAGGNDALGASQLLMDINNHAAEGFNRLAKAQHHFRRYYCDMLRSVLQTRKRVTLCNIYDSCPDLSESMRAGLSIYNDVIVQEAVRRGLPVIDLRLICDHSRDYSEISPIEPSEIGGAKIVRAIKRVLVSHDFSRSDTVVYGNSE